MKYEQVYLCTENRKVLLRQVKESINKTPCHCVERFTTVQIAVFSSLLVELIKTSCDKHLREQLERREEVFVFWFTIPEGAVHCQGSLLLWAWDEAEGHASKNAGRLCFAREAPLRESF